MNIDINKALEQLAAAFNTTVDALYPILIKQAYVSGVMDLVIGVGFILIALIGAMVLRRKWETIYHADAEFPVIFCASIFTLIAVVVIPMSLYGGISAVVNPEYWAIKQILSTISSN